MVRQDEDIRHVFVRAPWVYDGRAEADGAGVRVREEICGRRVQRASRLFCRHSTSIGVRCLSGGVAGLQLGPT